MSEGLLTESSCVCWLGEILWHFPVDIKSEERQKEIYSKCKYYVLKNVAHSVPIMPCDITEVRWNVSFGRPPLYITDPDGQPQHIQTHTRTFTGLQPLPLNVCSVIMN